jgi:hypothetical protein
MKTVLPETKQDDIPTNFKHQLQAVKYNPDIESSTLCHMLPIVQLQLMVTYNG